MSGQEIARRPDRTPLMQRDPVQLAGQFIASGLFKDMDLPKAVVKIVAGEELGIGPMASMTGIHVIEGKPSLSANLLGVQVKRSERYDYQPTELSAQKVVVEFFDQGQSVGTSEFTIEQAREIDVKTKKGWTKLADKPAWKNYPQAMLFARALSQGVRLYCPDVTAGSPAYTPEELGAEVDAEGEVVYVESTVEPAQETPTTSLDEDRVDALMKGFEIAGAELGGVTPLDGLNLLLGSLGVDGFDPNTDLREQMAGLSETTADALDAAFQNAVETDAEEVDGEVVEGGGADGE
jgi:hypothetical protein